MPGTAAPFISSFSPTFGASSDPGFITINGNGFLGGALVVRFTGAGGVQDVTAGAINDNMIQARVPVGAPLGPGPIFVSVGGNSTLSGDDFTVIGPGPYISDFSPTAGNSSTLVTINGAHFTNPLTVRFNGVSKTANPTSSTTFQMTPPLNVTTGPINASNTVGNYTTPNNFYVPPVITGFSPANGRVGTNVVIRGTNFTDATAVRFNNLNAPNFTVDSANQITAKVPTNAVTGPIRVDTPANNPFITSTNFRMLPSITSFSPTNGNVGTNITITGVNLNEGTSSVKIGGVTATINGSPGFSQIVVTVQNGTTNGPISVTTSNGTITTTDLFYMPPRITSFAPTNGPPGTQVIITGQNLLGASAVSFGGVPADFITPTNNTTLTSTVPSGVITGPITVTTPGGTTNSTALFYGPPIITGFTPTHGLPGTNVMITGTNFLGATAVRFNGTNASFVVTNNNIIGAIVPTNGQTGPISVVTPGGTNTTSTNFLFDAADVTVAVMDAPDPVLITSNLTYTIVVTNNGPSVPANVLLTNTLPASVTLKSVSAPGSLTTNGTQLICNLGALGVGASATMTVVVVPQTPGTIVNTASVSSTYPDSAPANNSATATTLVQPLPFLSIVMPAADRVRISWPLALTNYGLEFKFDPTTMDPWTNVGTLPETAGNESVIVRTNTEPMEIYRLRRQP